MLSFEDRDITCCFTGHRPRKLHQSEEAVLEGLEKAILQAYADGYRSFITGMAMGVDIWAGQIVLRKREKNPEIRLIAANPWPGMADRWDRVWRLQYEELLRGADRVETICGCYHRYVYQQRNAWMVDHSSRLIAYYNGLPGGTGNTVRYAEQRGLDVVLWEAGHG